MDTEILTVIPKGEDFEIVVRHDQTGNSYGITISNSAYEQLRHHFFNIEMCNDVYERVKKIYEKEIMDICNEEYSSDEKVIDIARIFVGEYDPHESSIVMCDLCSHKWVAVRPKGVTILECPNCLNMVNFENRAL